MLRKRSPLKKKKKNLHWTEHSCGFFLFFSFLFFSFLFFPLSMKYEKIRKCSIFFYFSQVFQPPNRGKRKKERKFYLSIFWMNSTAQGTEASHLSYDALAKRGRYFQLLKEQRSMHMEFDMFGGWDILFSSLFSFSFYDKTLLERVHQCSLEYLILAFYRFLFLFFFIFNDPNVYWIKIY